MRTAIDRSGRLVVPKELRDAVGMVAGPVDLHIVGNSIQIEVPHVEVDLVEDADGRLFVGATGVAMTDDDVRELRLAAQQR